MTDLEKYKLEDICYRSKKGQYVSPEELAWIDEMYKRDPEEYKVIQERAAKLAMSEVNPFQEW
jgi:hypothetical protein